MNSAVNWKDNYTITNDRILFTDEELHVPGLRVLARHTMRNAIPSLVWHFHENAFEFTMATKGNFTFSSESSDYTFSGGDVYVAFPNEIHGTNYVPITVGEIYWIQLDISDPENFLFLNREASEHLISRLKSISHHVIQTDAQKTAPLLKNAFSLALGGNEPEFIASFIQLFLHLVISFSEKEQFRLSPDIGRTLNYILDNITAELSLEELAALANLSCSQYKQKFKKQLGVSPRRFINHQKIEYSKQMLLDGASITDIAMTLNFTTSSYFSTVFKKYTLLTPMEYIKKHSEQNDPA